MKRYCYFILLFAIAGLSLHAAVHPYGLTCENTENPLGIDTPVPFLSWKINSDKRDYKQSGYEIIVSTSPDGPENGKDIVWKSGKVRGTHNINIPYKGKKLKPFTRYYWKVKVYDQYNEASEWSPIVWWETAMMQPGDWQGAQWIGDGTASPATDADFYKDEPAPLFRRGFRLKKEIKDARLYIAGLGYYEATINGEKVGDNVLDPGWTNFGKQILYTSYDVTSMLSTGENAIGVMLGNGFYNPLPIRIFQPLREYLYIGRPCVKAKLRVTYTDNSVETINTDTDWRTAPGPVLRNNVYLGERYDASREIMSWDTPSFNGQNWENASLSVIPSGELTSQMQPPIRVTEVINPVRMTETRPGEFVMDMGQNFAGVVRLRVKGPKGTTIKIRYGEDIYSDGSLNVMTSVAGQRKKVWNADWSQSGEPQTAWQEDRYTLKGEGEETWSPRFTFHGFRYIEITGWPGRPTLQDIEGLRMNSDVQRAGYFETSNPMLNKLNKALDYTFLSNIFSVQSDCPAREKFGYGGDIVGIARTFCWFYDMSNFYRKVVRDFANDQRPLGGMTETAPYNGIADRGLGDGSGPIGWQLAFGFLLKQLYEYYGDTRIIETNYPRFVKQVEFLRSQAKDNIIDKCINDHESLEPRIPELFATAHYYHHAILLAEFAGLIGKTKDEATYTRLAEDIRNSFINKFFNPGTGEFGNHTQGAQAMALYYNLLPAAEKERAFTTLLAEIDKRNGHIATGIFGTPAVLDVLTKEERNDIAYSIVTKEGFPGWMHMLQSGATTIWETWQYSDNVFSHNHPMFGSVGEWFYQALGGINAAEPGFCKIIIKPQPAGDLKWVNCTYQSIQGEIQSNWVKADNNFTLSVSIPANTTALVYLPVSASSVITEGGKPLAEAGYIKEMDAVVNGFQCFEVPSGDYSFKVSN